MLIYSVVLDKKTSLRAILASGFSLHWSALMERGGWSNGGVMEQFL